MKEKQKIKILEWSNEKPIVNIKGVERLNSFLRLLAKIVSVPFILMAAISCLLIGIFLVNLAQQLLPKDVEKYLSEIYGETKFKIVEQNTDQNGVGTYVMTPKKNQDIIFYVYSSGRNIKEDYSQRRLKYYIEHCEDTDLTEALTIQSNTEEENGISFLKYEVTIDISSYEELEKAVKQAYDLTEYLKKQDETMYEFIGIRKDSFYYSVNCENTLSYSDVLKEAKYTYFNCMKEKKDSFSEQERQEFKEIWKPKELQIIVNGKEVTDGFGDFAKVNYRPVEEYYYFTNMSDVIRNVESIKIVEEKNRAIQKIEYKGEVYELEPGPAKRKKNKLPMEGNVEMLKDFFGAEIIYDDENEKIEITIE